MFKIENMDHVAFTAADIDLSIAWYARTLGMERRYADVWTGRGDPAVMCAGMACVALFRPIGEGPIRPSDPSAHFAFKLDRANFEQAQADLASQGIEYKFRDHKICHSIYLYDPDGHEIELTTYGTRNE